MEKYDRSTEIKSVILSFTISSHQLKHVTNRVKPNAHSLINNIGKVQKNYKNKKVKSSLKFDDEYFLNEPTIGTNALQNMVGTLSILLIFLIKINFMLLTCIICISKFASAL